MGAVALVILVVALAPLILDRAPKSSTQHIDVQMPASGTPASDAPPSAGAPESSAAQGAVGAQTATDAAAQPTAGLATGGPADTRGPAPEVQAGAAGTSTSTPAANPDNSQGAAPVAPAPNEGAGAAPGQAQHAVPNHAGEQTHASADGYAVPIIATVSADKARALKQKLQKAKLPAYLEKTPDGGKTRVRVGPFKQKEAAERARQRLVKLGFDPGKVVPKGE